MPRLFDIPASLPFTPISPDVDPEKVALGFLPSLTTLSPSSITSSGTWRDLYALTGTLRTFYGPSSILTAWAATTKLLQPTKFSLQPNSAQIFRAGPLCWIQAIYEFETEKTDCQAIVSLVQDDGEWRIWLLRTFLMGFKGENSVDFLEPEGGKAEGKEDTSFDCVVVGAGQAGLSVAGRLKALGVSCVVLEKSPEVGDNWRMRYDSCKLHLPRETAHLPFDRTFGPECSEHLTKNELAQGYKNWVEKFDINVWTDTKLVKGDWDGSKKLWTLKVQRGREDRTITSSHVVFAVGSAQIPSMPEYSTREKFEGTILHSKDYKNPSAWKGKHGIVIGTANTAHDVVEDMVAAGLASVTMVQRSPTYVVPAEYLHGLISQSYNAQFPTYLADQFSWSMPYPIVGRLYKGGLGHLASLEPKRYDALKAAGFKFDQNGSVGESIFDRFGGHYVDVGASKKIADGLIKIKSDSLPTHYTAEGLAFADNSVLPADVVVFATGFQTNLRSVVTEIFSPSTADAMGDFWGVDSEGELRAAFRPGGQKGMFYTGGDQSQCRFYSRFIALSIKADVMGAPLPIYDGGS
ncbi:putative flavin-containing monooxygenase [Mollisia scopiformis]|uniref:Putative flavin-containing monooxygenase n=1 Tax=Mollisia scopiformis TaxID=149040 RepID=A0A194XD81_MOLSC|nr:putative flavin-containing monooxygenase [Mollisia scopiformis]KUJ17712.1 putative flavin-containing monooxygenase [Mollisia scopiformis]